MPLGKYKCIDTGKWHKNCDTVKNMRLFGEVERAEAVFIRTYDHKKTIQCLRGDERGATRLWNEEPEGVDMRCV